MLEHLSSAALVSDLASEHGERQSAGNSDNNEYWRRLRDYTRDPYFEKKKVMI